MQIVTACWKYLPNKELTLSWLFKDWGNLFYFILNNEIDTCQMFDDTSAAFAHEL